MAPDRDGGERGEAMTAEDYEEWLLGAQGKLLGHVTAAPEKEARAPVDRRFVVTDLPDPQHGGRRIWGAGE